MKKIIFIAVFIFSSLCVIAQNVALRLFEYMPAPGQHINIDNIGTPQAAQSMTTNFSSLVSLGSFGGYIVLGFENACINHPDNPYGIDFTIFGNAFSGSSEPGIVWVMNDENGNGLPDDTWYEIAGSSHYFSETKRNYAATYFKTPGRDVHWRDNLGNTGTIPANDFNLQEYYPNTEFFPSYPQDSITFNGTLLENIIVSGYSQNIKLAAPAFGYADCHPRIHGVELSLPDNPYTTEVEGAGGDPIDISWAIDSSGDYIDLDSIHFVKIVSASLNDAGWLGEVSTDIAWVQTVLPKAEISGKENLLVVKPHVNKILVGDSLQMEAVYFARGRKNNTPVSVQSLNESIAVVGSSGMLEAVSEGETLIQISANEEVQYTSVKVVAPATIQWLTNFSAVYTGDTLELAAQVIDNEQEILDLLPDFSSSDTPVGKILYIGRKAYFIALQPGEIVLTASIEGGEVKEQVIVKIQSPNDKIKLLLSVKTSDENLLPLQWVEVGRTDLNVVVENRQNDYSNLERITLFHALAAGLQKAKAPYKFRDDEAADGKLYLYKVEHDGLFAYSWGGKTNPSSYARAWIARLNNTHYFNDFDKITPSDGDTLVLYHVPDILNSWEYTRLLTVSNSSGAANFIEVMIVKTFCTIENEIISESGYVPVGNIAVFSGEIYYTDEQGIVKIETGEDFPLLVNSGNDAILIQENWVTDVSIPENGFRIYPNPVNDFVFINAKSSENYLDAKPRIRLINLTGTVVLEENDINFPVNLNLGFLPPGMYHLVIEDNQRSEKHKIIKR